MTAKKGKLSIKVILIIFLSGIFYSQAQQQQKIDVEQFLQKIKDILKQMEERAKQFEKKGKNKERKQEIRKKIIEKLSNPFSRLKHKVIKTKKPEDLSKTQPNEEENTSLQKNNQTLQRQINTFLNKNPQFVPFKFPDLKQFFQKSGGGNNPSGSNSSTSQGSQTSTATDTIDEETLSKYKAVKALYDQMIENLVNFWSMVWLIIKDQKRFDYIRNNLCKGEVADEVKEPKEIFGGGKDNKAYALSISRATGLKYDGSGVHFGELP
jgi:hypothetical protein